jgi:hypothetical protein
MDIPEVLPLPQLKNLIPSANNSSINKLRYYKNSSVFFEEIKKEEEIDITPKQEKNNLRKSLFGETRKSLLYENQSIHNLLLHEESNKNNANFKTSKFKELNSEKESPAGKSNKTTWKNK